MTKQIDELMALVADNFQATEYDSHSKLRTALEAALKPGDKVATLQAIVDSNTGFKRDAAPPAQTPVPPRLTEQAVRDFCEALNHSAVIAADIRAIESAVRKQFGVNDE